MNPGTIPARSRAARRTPPRAAPARRAFTLIEAVLATLIVAGLVVAALDSLGRLALTRQQALDSARGNQLAADLLEEILELPLATPPGVAPSAWDSTLRRTIGGPTATTVAAFHKFDDNPPTDRSGKALAGFTGWSRDVTVDDFTLSASALNAPAAVSGVRITVTARRNGKPVASIQSFRFPGFDRTRLLTPGVAAASIDWEPHSEFGELK